MSNAKGKTGKLLMIGLDAAEPRLIEQWSDEGHLPNLQKLRQGAAYGRLKSSADWLAGSPWPTFYTGTPPSEHGLYHAMQWRSEKMAPERPAPGWLGMTPFWRCLPDAGRKVVALDMPMTYAPERYDGTEICGWATHDLLAPPAAQPAGLMKWAEGMVGPRLISDEVYGPQKLQHLLKLRDELTAATEQLSRLTRAMMAEFQWDLFAVGFGALHRGGHKLWDHSGTLGEISEAEAHEFSQALRSLYIACDAAIGTLLERLDPDTSVLIFSLHGMAPNTSRADLLPEMLRRILAEGSAAAQEAPAPPGLLKRLRSAIPIEWRSEVKNRLPQPLQDRLTSFWRLGGTDWSQTEAFAAIADLQGYIRISVKGREAAGIVQPGLDYEALCCKIEDGLRTFVDADSGDPVVLDVKRGSEIFAEGSRLERLPDILVRWAESPAARHRSIASDKFGAIAWPTPGINPDGRSGNHRPEGFYLLRDPAVAQASLRADGHVLDLAPTIFQLMNLAPPEQMQGRPLFELQET
jgi:predicted AlkP superfamily phosphohydrolase/phosphomutase